MGAERDRVASFGRLEDGLRQAGDWNRWRYHYPQAAYPYQDLIEQNAARGRLQPEYELMDTGVFDAGRYWITEVHYAKAGPDDLLMAISVTNAGPEAATLHVLPMRLRLRPAAAATAGGPDPLGEDFSQVLATRRAEADEFYAELTPAGASADEAMVLRQAFAGVLWSKQLYYCNVARWLDGDLAQPSPPPQRQAGRNSKWRHFDAFDIMSMPDKWEYPWFAAWDLAFHCVALAHVDPAFAKYQLILLCREWFQHPNGALPAYEWDFSDVNPPVQAWAALEVFAIDGGRDIDFLSRIFGKLLVNFTWWVNLEDAGGNNIFEGGFLGLDNIGPLDRSHLPVGGIRLLQDDPAWRDNLIFSEYFHGDNGAAIGAAHQTGWIALIADVIRRRYGEVCSVGDIFRLLRPEPGQ